MNFVEPIRDVKQIEMIKGNLYRKKNPRDYLMLVFGLNSGLRISDILSLKLGDVKDFKGNLKDYLIIKEQKTGKTRKVFFNKQIKDALNYYITKTKIFNLDQYFFTNEKSNKNIPLSRVRAYQLINKFCRDVGITFKVGGHTLRKSYAFHLIKQGASIEQVSHLLNHQNLKVTFRYIGIDDDECKEVINNFGL